ncbi:MAG: hypothetical protein Q8P15_02900, partial [Nanoarchaeota archaeon]|nr:hypothetical protein [Nanoarchaeota archaeon]
NIKSFLEKKIKSKKGNIVDENGNVLGKHPGTEYFTIGQKIQDHLGLKINKPKEHAQDRYYIVEKRKNTLLIAPEGSPLLKKQKVLIKNFHLINPSGKIPPKSLTARIRHLGKLYSGDLIKDKKGHTFKFSKSVDSPASGQSIVIYHKKQVIGGGEIRLK